MELNRHKIPNSNQMPKNHFNSMFLIFSIFFLESMDLPPDKAKRLKNYDNKKKWEMLCDQVSKATNLEFKIQNTDARDVVCFVQQTNENENKI